MYNGQLELSFGSRASCLTVTRRQRRMSRAHWWFDRMRQVVDQAVDRRPKLPPRPQQTWFPGAQRSIEIQASEMEHHQVCE